MGSGIRSHVVEVVVVHIIIVLGMHSLVSCFSVQSSNLAVVEVIIWMLRPWMRR